MLGSPPRTSWKNVWGNSSNASTSSAGQGIGGAASERLYKSAATQRAARERLQRQVSERCSSAARSPREMSRQADAIAKRFAHVLTSSGCVGGEQITVPVAGVNVHTPESSCARESLNYGDMLFQEGTMQRQRKEAERQQELQKREEEELRLNCPFKPTVSVKAATYAPREHISERLQDVTNAHRERMQLLAEEIRGETERDFTFKPIITSKKSKALVASYGNFLDEMKARDELHERKLRELRASRAEEERKDYTFKPCVSSRASSIAGDEASTSLAPHERLYEQHTASYQASLAPPSTSDAECTFQPNVGKGPAAKTRAELEELADSLYRDAHNRRVRRQILQEQLDAELAEVRNERKLSAKSDRLAFQKLQRDVVAIFDRLEATNRGLKYNELAATLVELSVLRYAHVDGSVQTAQAKEEVLLLQRLWRHLAAKPEQPLVKAATADDVASSKAAASSDANGSGEASAGSAETTGSEATIKSSGESVVHRTALLTFLADALVPPEDGEPLLLDGDPGLHSDFRSFYRNTLAYKNIRNLKPGTESQLAQCEEFSFEPQLDHRSRRLERAREVLRQQTNPDAPKHRHDQLFRHAKSLEHKQEMERIQAHKDQMQECSFKPKINRVDGRWAEPAALSMGSERFAHLHAKASSEAKERTLSSTELEIAQECTFKPRIISYTPPREGKKALGYDKAVKRLQYAAGEKERRVAEEEAETSKKAALAFAMKPPKPFSFETAKRAERKTPLLYMDVNLGPGRTGRIGLHQGDDPVQLAANFARAYQLDATMRNRLQQLIERYMTEVVPELAAQAMAATDLSSITSQTTDKPATT